MPGRLDGKEGSQCPLKEEALSFVFKLRSNIHSVKCIKYTRCTKLHDFLTVSIVSLMLSQDVEHFQLS